MEVGKWPKYEGFQGAVLVSFVLEGPRPTNVPVTKYGTSVLNPSFELLY